MTGLLDGPPLSLGTADARYARNGGFYNIGAATTRKARKPLAAVRAGTGSMKLLCVGDSTTRGAGVSANFGADTAYPEFLRSALNSYYAPAVRGLHIAPSVISGAGMTVASDARWTAGTGWTLGAYGYAGGSGWLAPAGITTALTLAPGVSCDSFDIWYAQSASGGTVDLSIDGGAVTTKALTGGTIIAKTTITAGGVANNHVLKIQPQSTANASVILGVEPRTTGQAAIRVSNVGVDSSMASHWLSNGSNFASYPFLGAYAPDLSLIMLGINDAYNGITRGAYMAAITPIAAQCAVSGDVILMSPFPSQDTTAAGFEAQYSADLQTLALAQGYGFIDLQGRFVSWTVANANGWMQDAKHPKTEGYADAANAILAALRTL